MVSNQDKEDMIWEARRMAIPLGVGLRENDDPVSILGKVMVLKKGEVVRLLNHVGWLIYHWRGSDHSKVVTPADVSYFVNVLSSVALSTGIPVSLRGDVHPLFFDFSALFSLASLYFAHYHRELNCCSQEALRWLLIGIGQISREALKDYSILTEVDQLLKGTEDKKS